MSYTPAPARRDPTDVVGRRIAAYLIDIAIVSVIAAVLWGSKMRHVTGAPVDACRLLRQRESTSFCVQSSSDLYYVRGSDAALLYGVTIGAGFLLHVLLQGLTGASIGKFLTGLRVVDGEGRTCGIPRALLRWLFLVVDGFCFVVGLVVVLASHPHRRVGDLVAGTYVVGKDDAGRPPVPRSPFEDATGPVPWAGASGWTPPGMYAPMPPPPPGPPLAPGWGEPPRGE